MKFTKMHGAGNDYIFLNCMDGLPEQPAALARALSDRHFGVGGDGLICIGPSQAGDFQMRIFNADGSQGEMCGNGIRCAGKFVYELGLTDKTELVFETLAGLRRVELCLAGGRVTAAVADMGIPAVAPPRRVLALGRTYTGTPVSMGNPHFVLEEDGLAQADLPALGRALERLPCFPGGVNVELVRVAAWDELEMRVWERGSGETLACGTGACAAAAALIQAGRLGRQVSVRLPGGRLEVEWPPGDGHMYMTGPAAAVFHGKLAD